MKILSAYFKGYYIWMHTQIRIELVRSLLYHCILEVMRNLLYIYIYIYLYIYIYILLYTVLKGTDIVVKWGGGLIFSKLLSWAGLLS